MLTVLRDDHECLQAALNWYLVDDQGRYDPHGQWVYLEQLEMNNHGFDRKDAMRQLIPKIAPIVPKAVGAYWVRRDTTGNTPHAYSRARLLAFANKHKGG